MNQVNTRPHAHIQYSFQREGGKCPNSPPLSSVKKERVFIREVNFFLATTKIFLLPHRVTRIEMYLPPTSNKLNSTFLVYYVKTGESTSTGKHFLKKRTNAKITISQQLTIKRTFCGSSAPTSSQGLSSSPSPGTGRWETLGARFLQTRALSELNSLYRVSAFVLFAVILYHYSTIYSTIYWWLQPCNQCKQYA